jgi:hypothetical protein
MFHTYVAAFYLNVAKLDLDVALLWLYTHHVSSVCFKCFICFQSLIASVSLLDVSKVDLGGAHVAMAPVACGQLPAIAACYCC